ncbi:mechanosensitive ion channel family protein [Pseudoroseicyclus aestuarii]|uniref:Small-conductance mechanosensitive channel n=1 Tax=Pseudoroseicyclus aestuarii TaxID=1795041 RepID=A0A318T613_9RHOB|nr:mechanosensitive ion channel family protein [Pseudoroseicyclus aestuarii]PYE83818.1 small-conductance mechanosensitive channel [Pseudoroseicyclus aestuarii]
MDEIDPAAREVLSKLDQWADGFFRLLPNIAVALVVLLLFVLLSRVVRRLALRAGHRRGRENLGEVGGSLLSWTVRIVGLMLAVTIVAPSITPADLLSGLGIGSVAVGFAFKDILQNLLAGILILIRQPFEIGDQIVSGGHEGTVEKIETRATLIRTYDGRRVVIPNSDIYTDAVIVNTAFAQRRTEHDVMIGSDSDWAEAVRLMVKATAGCEGVAADPAPEALPWEIGESGNIIKLRWWTDSRRASVVHVNARVIHAVYIALTEAGIELPYPKQVVIFAGEGAGNPLAPPQQD